MFLIASTCSPVSGRSHSANGSKSPSVTGGGGRSVFGSGGSFWSTVPLLLGQPIRAASAEPGGATSSSSTGPFFNAASTSPASFRWPARSPTRRAPGSGAATLPSLSRPGYSRPNRARVALAWAAIASRASGPAAHRTTKRIGPPGRVVRSRQSACAASVHGPSGGHDLVEVVERLPGQLQELVQGLRQQEE